MSTTTTKHTVDCPCGHTFPTTFPQRHVYDAVCNCPMCGGLHRKPEFAVGEVIDAPSTAWITEKKKTKTNTETPSNNKGDTEVHCDCGNSFFTDFPLESNPPCAYCPHCRKLHRKAATTTTTATAKKTGGGGMFGAMDDDY